jgi:hypothetical protein
MSNSFGIPSTIGTIVEGDAWRIKEQNRNKKLTQSRKVQHLKNKKPYDDSVYTDLDRPYNKPCNCGSYYCNVNGDRRRAEGNSGFIMVEGGDKTSLFWLRQQPSPSKTVRSSEIDKGLEYQQIRHRSAEDEQSQFLHYCPEPEFENFH